MNSSQSYNKNALKHLRKDPVMKKLIETLGLLSWEGHGNDIFSALIRAIINQQLSTKSAATIYHRFLSLFPGQHPTPEELLQMKPDTLRATGISYTKIGYIHGICEKIINGQFCSDVLLHQDDEDVIRELTKLKGIGAWSAEMILIATLKRPDVFSVGDLGLRTAVAKWYGVDRNNHKKIEEISLAWRPYRSLACRYLWRSLSEK